MLANPPYVRHEKIKDLKPLLENTYACYTGVADLYVYFFERGVKLLRDGGVLSFISSNKFFRAGYGEKLRNFLRKNTELQTVIDFGDLPIFEANSLSLHRGGPQPQPDADREVRTLNVKTVQELARLHRNPYRLRPRPLAQTGLRDRTTWQLECH